MLIDARRSDAPELDASYDVLDLRLRDLRVARARSRGIITDWGMLNRAAPFVDRFPQRSALTIVVDGQARFDEHGAHAFLDRGEAVLSDLRCMGTEAYAGSSSYVIVIEWAFALHGAEHAGDFARLRFSARDIDRLRAAADRLDGEDPEAAIVDVLDVVRAAGLPIHRLGRADLRDPSPGELQQLQHAVSRSLSSLEASPTIEDLASALGWNQRNIHRCMRKLHEHYRTYWSHWRELAHRARLMHALKLLASPAATTETVARLSGFRAPSALCHAFAKAGLASPARIARMARGDDALARWSELVAR